MGDLVESIYCFGSSAAIKWDPPSNVLHVADHLCEPLASPRRERPFCLTVLTRRRGYFRMS